MKVVNYLTDAAGKGSCQECGRPGNAGANFCELCGTLQARGGNASIESLVLLRQAGHIDDSEYLNALRIQDGKHLVGVVTVDRPLRTRVKDRARMRIKNELAAVCVVFVVAVGLTIGNIQTTSGGETSRGYDKPELLTLDAAGQSWDLHAARPAVEHFAALDLYWSETTSQPYSPVRRLLEVSAGEVNTGCTADTTLVYWCEQTDTIVYDSDQLDALAERGGDGLVAAVLTHVSAERAHRTRDLRSRACYAGAYLASFDADGSGDIPLALLRTHTVTGHPERESLGRVDLALASYDGYRGGLSVCGQTWTRIDNRVTTGADPRQSAAVAAAVDAAGEAFLGISRVTINPDQVQPDRCLHSEQYAGRCGPGISYNSSGVAELTRRYGSFAGAGGAIFVYTEIQQKATGSRTGIRGQYCGLGAAAKQVQYNDELYGAATFPQPIVLANLDPVLNLLAWESNLGDAGYGALAAVADGFTRGAGVCL